MFYWYRVQRHRKLSQEQWDSKKPKRKGKGLDCSIMMDDDGSDSSSTHANNLNHNTEPLPSSWTCRSAHLSGCCCCLLLLLLFFFFFFSSFSSFFDNLNHNTEPLPSSWTCRSGHLSRC
ncbi:unnamed protein product [Oncorhynchus mykiss]|uniref:Uncharacterized protein n=1 Tax=Oncorhynchus mykiss TaxID=8022 RepID=A0A060Z9E2_ONCMY|nr:unnamed protein product [Oncorhynchus mykiss]